MIRPCPRCGRGKLGPGGRIRTLFGIQQVLTASLEKVRKDILFSQGESREERFSRSVGHLGVAIEAAVKDLACHTRTCKPEGEPK